MSRWKCTKIREVFRAEYEIRVLLVSNMFLTNNNSHKKKNKKKERQLMHNL